MRDRAVADVQRERRIAQLQQALTRTHNTIEARFIAAALATAVMARSPEAVEELERAKGLAA